MPTVHGELTVQMTGASRKTSYKFGCHCDNNNGEYSCVMIRDFDMIGNKVSIYIKCHKNHIELWLPGVGSGAKSYLTQNLKYSELDIVWCTYKGIPQTQKAELQQAA